MSSELHNSSLTDTYTQLPSEYVEFMSNFNGGACKLVPIELENGVEVLCDCLFGFGLQQELNFEFWQSELEGELPDGSVAIGSCPGGGFFLLLKTGQEWGLWYYDHSYSLSSSSDLNNTYQCKIALSNLLSMVTRPFNA
jgi:hypothetical protein